MSDYKYQELISDLREELGLVEKFKNESEIEMKKYKGLYETDDKFEIQRHEFWRATSLELNKQMLFLRKTLKKQEDLFKEEVEQMAQADEFNRELRYTSKYGI